MLAFILGSDDEFHLSYVINVEATNSENKKDKYELFINSESGEIMNVKTNIVK